MANKTGAFEGGDDIEDSNSPFKSTLSNDDSGEQSIAFGSIASPQAPSEECDQWMVDSSHGFFSNSSSVSADASGSSAQSSGNTSADKPLEKGDENRCSLEASAPNPLPIWRPVPLDDRFLSRLSLPCGSLPVLESPPRTRRKHSSLPSHKLVEQERKTPGLFQFTFGGTKPDTYSSSDSDSSTESVSVQKDSTVRKMKQAQKASTSRSLHISKECESPRRDPLNLNTMQGSFNPLRLSEESRLSKSSPRKRLQSTQLERPKSTSPGTSYSKLPTEEFLDNVHRNVPDSEIMSQENSENQQSLSPEISESPRRTEPVSLSLALPSSGDWSSTFVRFLLSDSRSSAPCEPNPVSPVSQFAIPSNPSQHEYSQHAPPAHLQETRKFLLPSCPRILYPAGQQSCHLPRSSIFPDRSPILNFPRHNPDPKGTRIQPPQDPNSKIQVSKSEITDKSDHRYASKGELRTSAETFLQKVDDKIEDLLRSSPIEPPKLLFNVSAPSETLSDTIKPSEALLDAPEPSEALLDAPEPSEALLDAPETSETNLDAPGSSKANLNAPGSSKVNLNAPGSSKVKLNVPGSSEVTLNVPGSSEVTLNAPGSFKVTLNAPGSSRITLNAPGSSEVMLNAPGTSNVLLNAPGTSDVLLNAPGTSDITRNAPKTSDITRNAPKTSDITRNAPKTYETLANFPDRQAQLVIPRASQVLLDSAPSGDFHSQSTQFQSTTATLLQIQPSSSIEDLLHSLLSMYLGLCERVSRPSTSNRQEYASVPSIGPGEASTSSYQPLSLTRSREQLSSLSDFPQSTLFSENVSGLDMHLPFRGSSDYMERARNMFREICRDILKDQGDNRWLEFNWPLSRTSSPAASDNIVLKFNRMMSKSETNILAERVLLITGLTRSDMPGKECRALSLREAVLSVSYEFFIQTISSKFSSNFDDVLHYYNMITVSYNAFMSLKTATLVDLDSADDCFRQRMPLLLDQISSYFTRLLLALQNLLHYFR